MQAQDIEKYLSQLGQELVIPNKDRRQIYGTPRDLLQPRYRG